MENNADNTQIEAGEELTEVQETHEPEESRSEKLFTQEQVNEIVRKRLEKQKQRDGKDGGQELDIKIAELTSRESRLNCREYLIDKGYPAELLDVIDTSDVDAFMKKADRVCGLLGNMQPKHVAPLGSTEPRIADNIRNGFQVKAHNPKFSPAYFVQDD